MMVWTSGGVSCAGRWRLCTCLVFALMGGLWLAACGSEGPGADLDGGTLPDGAVPSVDGGTRADGSLPPTTDGGAPDANLPPPECTPDVCAAHTPLDILQPLAGLDTRNRFYKAYPGIPFHVWVAVQGGAYPYTFGLTEAPAGMTVDAATGRISWPSPTETGSPHAATLRVRDLAGNEASVSWTITATRDGFLFLDATNGRRRSDGATGTLEDPFRSIADWYAISTDPTTYDAKYEMTYPGQFIYYRAGTYDPAHAYPTTRSAPSSSATTYTTSGRATASV